MAIEMLVEQIRTMPQECSIEVQNYVNYVLYRYNQTSKKKENINLFIHKLNENIKRKLALQNY